MITVVKLDREQPPQVAYAVGRGVGHAPARNRVRRRLRHVIRARAAELQHSRAYLVAADASAAARSFDEVDTTIGALLSELGAESP